MPGVSRWSLKMPPRAPLNYLGEVGPARAHAAVVARHALDTTTTNVIGCWLFGGSRNTDGYGQVFMKKNSEVHLTGRSSQTAFLLHRLSFLAAHGRDVHGHCSHLCDIRACFNPEHLVDETPTANNSRKGCPGPVICPDHGHVVVDLCSHQPRCIRPPNPNVFCCLSIRETPSQGWLTSESGAETTGDETEVGLTVPGLAHQMLERSSSEFAGAAELEAALGNGEVE